MPATVTRRDLEAALPDVATRVRLRGLERPTEVYRDRWGIPHVRAQNEHDAFFAQGFVTAQDRLWHMDFDRRRALGEWASLGGKSAAFTRSAVRSSRSGTASRSLRSRSAVVSFGKNFPP